MGGGLQSDARIVVDTGDTIQQECRHLVPHVCVVDRTATDAIHTAAAAIENRDGAALLDGLLTSEVRRHPLLLSGGHIQMMQGMMQDTKK